MDWLGEGFGELSVFLRLCGHSDPGGLGIHQVCSPLCHACVATRGLRVRTQWPVSELERMCICRIGGAKVLLAGVFLWSLGTLVAPPCAKLGVSMQQLVNLRLCTVSLLPSAEWCGQHTV